MPSFSTLGCLCHHVYHLEYNHYSQISYPTLSFAFDGPTLWNGNLWNEAGVLPMIGVLGRSFFNKKYGAEPFLHCHLIMIFACEI